MKSRKKDFFQKISFILILSGVRAANLPNKDGKSSKLFSPRMDYDQWTPLGRGDPLKNDPTYDYVPPVLDRVHYWENPGKKSMETEKKNEILVLGVSSKKPSNNSNFTKIENRRDQVAGDQYVPNYNRRTFPFYQFFQKNDFFKKEPLTILVPPPLEQNLDQNFQKAVPMEISTIGTTEFPTSVSIDSSNLIYQSSSVTGSDWLKGTNSFGSVAEVSNHEYTSNRPPNTFGNTLDNSNRPSNAFGTSLESSNRPSNAFGTTLENSSGFGNSGKPSKTFGNGPSPYNTFETSGKPSNSFGTQISNSYTTIVEPSNSFGTSGQPPKSFGSSSNSFKTVVEPSNTFGTSGKPSSFFGTAVPLNPNSFTTIVEPSNGFGTVPESSNSFVTIVEPSNTYGKVPHSSPDHSNTFGTVAEPSSHVTWRTPLTLEPSLNGNQMKNMETKILVVPEIPVHKGQVSDDTLDISNTFVNIGKTETKIQPMVEMDFPMETIMPPEKNAPITFGPSLFMKPHSVKWDDLPMTLQMTMQTSMPTTAKNFLKNILKKETTPFLPTTQAPVYTTPSTTTTTSTTARPYISSSTSNSATTSGSMTTDPLFRHYRQPMEPLRGPLYLIIQGHSKVKTYGPSKQMNNLHETNEILTDDNQLTDDNHLTDDSFPVKHLHITEKKEEWHRKGRNEKFSNLNEIVKTNVGALEVFEGKNVKTEDVKNEVVKDEAVKNDAVKNDKDIKMTNLYVKYDVSNDKESVSEVYKKGIVENEKPPQRETLFSLIFDKTRS